jgi:hypothetical protein
LDGSQTSPDFFVPGFSVKQVTAPLLTAHQPQLQPNAHAGLQGDPSKGREQVAASGVGELQAGLPGTSGPPSPG